MGSWSQTFNLKSGFTKSCHWKKNRKGKVSKVNKGIKRMRRGRERTAGEEHSRVSIRKPKNRLCVKMVPDYHIALDQPPSFSHSFIPTLRVFPPCLYCTSMWIVFFFLNWVSYPSVFLALTSIYLTFLVCWTVIVYKPWSKELVPRMLMNVTCNEGLGTDIFEKC